MKKLLALLLVLTLTVSMLAACGKKAEPVTEGTTTEGATTDEATAETTEGEGGIELTAADPHNWAPYDELIAKIYAETDPVAREALMHEAEDMLMSTYAINPIYYYNDIYLLKPEVKGIYSNAYGFKYFENATNGDKDTLKLCLASEPAKLDPALNSSVDGACLAVTSFAPLYKYASDGSVVPALATGYELSEDGLTYIFTMRDGLKWSDGSPLTAKDVEYSWKRASDPKTGGDYAYMFTAFDGYDTEAGINVTASEDGKTLTAVLAAPTPYFLDLVAFPAYYPVPQANIESAKGFAENPGAWATEAGFVSSGAYTLKSWKHNESMVYEKNPNYYDAENVKLEKLEFMLSDDDTAIFAAYNAGDLDFADTVPTDEIAGLIDNPEFYIIDNLGTYYVSFNVKSPLFEGKTIEQAAAMRKAFALLVDRDYITENIGQAGQKIATSFIPANMMDGHGGEFKVNDTDYTYPVEDAVGYIPETVDTDTAIALLEYAGFEFDDSGILSSNTPISFEYLTNDTSGHIAIAEAIQQDLAVIGVNMTIKSIEWAVFLEERKSGNYDVSRNGWIADFNDPINMLEMWTTQSGNNDIQFGR